MRARRAVALVAAGTFAGVLARRKRQVAKGRAEVWFDDGSMVSVPRSSPAGERVVELAEDVLRSVR